MSDGAMTSPPHVVGADVSAADSDREVGRASMDSARPVAVRPWRVMAFGFAAVVGLGLLLVSARLEFLRASYDLAAEERTAERLIEERRHLVVERASLRSPARLASEAALRTTLERPLAERWARWPDLGAVERWPW